MKKALSLLLSLILILALALPAFAADYEPAADDLNAIDLFRGTGWGYELDRTATRPEAAAMLVRLLGAEEAAMTQYEAGLIRHPFGDVAEWADPYVAWLYVNGLTKGVSADAFGSSLDCTDQMYCTFLLRSLGYTEETGDFTYEAALTEAAELGLYDPFLMAGGFLRDEMAAVSCQALATPVKDSDRLLVEKLIDDGALDAGAAADFVARANAWQRLSTALSASDAADAVAMSLKIRSTAASGTAQSSVDTGMELSVRIADSGVEMAASGTSASEGQSSDFGYWLRDGVLYVDAMGAQSSVPFPLDLSSSAAGGDGIPLYLTDAVTLKDGVYTVDCGSRLTGLLRDLMGQMGSAFVPSDSSLVYSFTLDGAGRLQNLQLVMRMTSSTGAAVSYELSGTVSAWGDAVTVTYPDLSGFRPVSGAAG